MKQKKPSLGSGIGNYLGVEILLHARISPHTKIINIYNDKSLSDKLAESIKYILKSVYLTGDIGYLEHLDSDLSKFVKILRTHIKNNPKNKYNYHSDVILLNNEKFKFNVYRQKKFEGHDVVGEEIIPKRTTYWIPDLQVL